MIDEENNISNEEESAPLPDQPIHDLTVDNSNKSANKDDYDSDMDRYEQASRASEASFTLEPEKGLTPDPDTLNKETEKDDNHLKK